MRISNIFFIFWLTIRLPDFVKDGIEYIRKYGLTTPGIFRTSPPQDEFNLVLSKIEKGKKKTFFI